jgi:hypothetical protein
MGHFFLFMEKLVVSVKDSAINLQRSAHWLIFVNQARCVFSLRLTHHKGMTWPLFRI